MYFLLNYDAIFSSAVHAIYSLYFFFSPQNQHEAQTNFQYQFNEKCLMFIPVNFLIFVFSISFAVINFLNHGIQIF